MANAWRARAVRGRAAQDEVAFRGVWFKCSYTTSFWGSLLKRRCACTRVERGMTHTPGHASRVASAATCQLDRRVDRRAWPAPLAESLVSATVRGEVIALPRPLPPARVGRPLAWPWHPPRPVSCAHATPRVAHHGRPSSFIRRKGMLCWLRRE
eukprot:316530-Prymnesium_polylepis.1